DAQSLGPHARLAPTAGEAPRRYRAGAPGAGTRPQVTAAASPHNAPDAPDTKLFEIDAARNVPVLQAPPNDGVLVTIGPLGVDFGPTGGFDIVTDAAGQDEGCAPPGASLPAIRPATRAAPSPGAIGDGPAGGVGHR